MGDSELTRQSREEIRKTYGMSGEEYDEWRLADERGLLLSEHDQQIFNQMFPELPADARVLEIGAGTGRFTIPALERGVTMTAADINQSLLTSLREKVKARGFESRCEIREADIFNLDFPDESFDLVFSLHVIPRFTSLDDQRAALCEVTRVIRPGGMLLFNYRGSRSFINLLYQGHATPPAEVARSLAEGGMRIVQKRGKWLLNRKLINLIGPTLARGVGGIDRLLQGFAPDYAWDIFVLAEKG